MEKDDKDSANVELDKVQILVRKANRELIIHGRRLFIRKLLGLDKETENLICILEDNVMK